MDGNWTHIHSTGVPYKAEILKSILEENDIEAIVINKQDSSYHFGELEIYVKAEDVIKAKHLIASHNEF